MRDPTLLGEFTRHVAEDGQRIALVDHTGFVTYGALHRRTNQLARALERNGIGPGVFVGIALQRSSDLVVAILAVVKAGGAYVPLDPDYPPTRLERMLNQVRPRVVITSEILVSRLPATGSTILHVEAPAESEEDLSVKAGPEDPLYVIFTSGSTGDPKGAVVQRRGFANLIEWFGCEFAIGPEDRFLLLSSPSFDLTQKNFFAPLRAGGRLVIFPSGPFDLTLLAQMIERHGITAINCTPSAFYPLVDTSRQSRGSLRLAVLGGEPISIPRVRPWLESSGPAEIANTYGPTECTDICGYYRLNRGNIDDFSFVPLGSTIPNVQLAVVDEALKPLPQGEPGELIIGGTGVGLGYLGDPERTAACFVANPLPGELVGPLVYRTGDRVQLRPEGVLEFLGRADHQVKLRGFRIELSEIEIAMASHPSIREAAVVVRKSKGEPTLLAFHIPKDQAKAATAEEIQAFLATRLPEYMVPVHFKVLAAFPLTPNGKVDRLKLAAEGSRKVAPVMARGNETESILLTLWAAALGHEEIGLDDNFFDLGGNSIQLAMVHARVIGQFGKPIPITDLFTYSTIRTLAEHLSGSGTSMKTEAIRDRALKQRQALAARRQARV